MTSSKPFPSSSGSSSGSISIPEDLTLYILGSHPNLPTIDPSSLYLTSLLIYSYSCLESSASNSDSSSFKLCTINPFIHESFPILESQSLNLATGISSIKSLLLSLNPSLSDDQILNPTCLPLHSIIQSKLEPLVLHHLFSIQQNYQVTSNLYSKHLNLWNRSSTPSQLRKQVKNQLEKLGIWNSASSNTGNVVDSKEADELDEEWRNRAPRTSEEMAERQKELKRKRRGTTSDAFGNLKIEALSKEPLEILSSSLGESDYFFGSETPRSLDFHLFSLLSPLLHTPLPKGSLPNSLKLYPNLISHTQRLKDLLYPIDSSTSERIGLWSEIRVEEDRFGNKRTEIDEGRFGFVGDLASSAWNLFNIPNAFRKNQVEGKDKEEEKKEEKEKDREVLAKKKIKRGRNLWILTSVVGLIGYLFVSGIISVELGEAQKIEEEVMEEEVEGGEGWTEVGDQDDEEEEMEEEEFELEEDDEE